MLNNFGQGIKNGLSNIGQDLSYGAGFIGNTIKLNQQYSQQLAAKKKNLASKMMPPAATSTPAQPSFMQNLSNNVNRNLTSVGRNQQYLQQ